jgi:hypothetical protein
MIQFPTLPRGAGVKPKLVRYGGDLVSSLGGPTQRITRPGTRYGADITLPTLDAPCAAEWLAVALQADTVGDTVGLVMPQTIAAMRTMTGVTGTGNAGTASVQITGSTPEVGAWFSFIAGGRHYLHLVTAVKTAAPVTLTITPLLRASITSAPLEFEAPILEGFTDAAPAWDVAYSRFVTQTFSVTESA